MGREDKVNYHQEKRKESHVHPPTATNERNNVDSKFTIKWNREGKKRQKIMEREQEVKGRGNRLQVRKPVSEADAPVGQEEGRGRKGPKKQQREGVATGYEGEPKSKIEGATGRERTRKRQSEQTTTKKESRRMQTNRRKTRQYNEETGKQLIGLGKLDC